ncbi:MAG: hypothetical protein ABIJ37_05535 [Pseudomonadota bacterium]
MKRKLLRCKECNEIIKITEHDFSFEYHYDEENDCFLELAKNDREPFITKHKNHKLEELEANMASFISDRPYSEPLKTSYFEATNGRENFVIKSWRDKVESPLRYEMVEGYIEITNRAVINGEDIRKQIQAEIIPIIPQDKITLLIHAIEKVVSQLDPEDMMEDSFESDNPLVLCCKLKNNTIKSIVELSRDIFEEEQFKKVRDFIYDNSDYDGVIAPLIKRQFTIKPISQMGKISKEEGIFPADIGPRDILAP